MAIYKSIDGGETWAAKAQGLPTENCFFTGLRQALATDTRAGEYFCTNSGSVLANTDDDETWAEIVRHVPTVLRVEVLEPA